MVIKSPNNLDINVSKNRKDLGIKSSEDIEKKIQELLTEKSEIRIIFAAAPSQNETLEYLVKSKNIEWNRITAFHMDEYIGLPENASQLFSNFLSRNLFNNVPFKKIHLIDGTNTIDECERYGKLIAESAIDIVCLGIGENGHIAFNDPPVADFNDSEIVKEVKLDQVCRQQQVNDGCFNTINEVPTSAYTLTIPALMSGNHLFCIVPGETKKEAVYQTLNYPDISTNWPSTILRTHKDCKFYFDIDSFGDNILLK
jgi:glucosamine-6-phosphate deaminase